jgi:hypothetical protein
MGFRLAFVSFPALALAASAAACSSSPEATGAAKAPATTSTKTTVDAGVEAAGPSTLASGCPANSGYIGDDMCLAAPSSTDGFQLHYGVPGEYTDPTAEAPFVLQPGGEINDCYYETTANTTDQYIGGFDFQMRPGSHHIIMNVNPTAQADGFATCGANDLTPGLLYSSETPTYDLRTDPAPENQGKLAGSHQFSRDQHHLQAGSSRSVAQLLLR